MSGGGIAGLLYGGMAMAFKTLGMSFDHISGCSIGSLVALMFCLQCTPDEMCGYLINLSPSTFYAELNFAHLIDSWAFSRGDQLGVIIDKIITGHAGNADITFNQLYELNGNILNVQVTCVDDMQSSVHNYITTPDFKVKSSILASMSVPLLFPPVLIYGKRYVDGGLTENIPLMHSNSEDSLVAILRPSFPNGPVTSFSEYIQRIIYCPLNTLQKIQESSIRGHVLNLHAGIASYSTVSELKKKELIQSGYEQTMLFFSSLQSSPQARQ